MASVFIIDDRESVRQALSQRLSRVPGIHVVGSTGNSRDGVAELCAARPDVVLLELKLADGRGFDTLRAIRASCPFIRVIVVTSYLDDLERQVAMKLGAERYLLKDIDTQKLADVILTAAPVTGAISEGENAH